MENTPNNNLISDICDKIASGYNFGGWTDPMDERVLGAAEARAVNRIRNDKFKVDTTNKMARAKVKDIRQDPRDSIRQR